jgi:L-alanine-DL-glutamate epimerase-like enolase superfamily enzyme
MNCPYGGFSNRKPMVQKLALKKISFFLRDIRLRLPFRFGAFTAEEVPLLHVAVEVEASNGRRVKGFAADNLVPRWFDKSPEKTVGDNILDLLRTAQMAADIYSQAGKEPLSVWRIWRDAYGECHRRGASRGFNRLVSSFGSSLFERALTDAAGKLAGLDLVSMLRKNTLDLQPSEVHPELSGADLQAWANQKPPSTLMVRHTVGLLDPLVSSDLPPDGGPNDGLPRTLEENVVRYGLRYFKLKVGGNADADIARLSRIAGTLDRLIPGKYAATLDGNEQYKSIEEFSLFSQRLRNAPPLKGLVHSLAFIEQPLDRAIALDPHSTRTLSEVSRFCPVIIDESDDGLEVFKEAVELGYRGVSTKNCKGILKSFLNRTMVENFNLGRPGDQKLFMSGEDLTNLPVVPLQQDLATVRALGIPHLERNGHHYVRGLDHCSPEERKAAVRLHGDLYREDERGVFLKIENGEIRVDSLNVPGYGVAFEPDLPSMIPLEEWIAAKE